MNEELVWIARLGSDLVVIAGDNRAKLNAVINAQADAMLGYSMDQNLKIAAAKLLREDLELE